MYEHLIVDRPALDEVERAERELAFIQTEPAKWNQRYYFSPAGDAEDPDSGDGTYYVYPGHEWVPDTNACGAYGCLAGWTVAHEGYLISEGRGMAYAHPLVPQPDGRQFVGQRVGEVSDLAAKLLGLRRGYVGNSEVHPFAPDNSLADLQTFVRELRERYEAVQLDDYVGQAQIEADEG